MLTVCNCRYCYKYDSVNALAILFTEARLAEGYIFHQVISGSQETKCSLKPIRNISQCSNGSCQEPHAMVELKATSKKHAINTRMVTLQTNNL